MELLLSLRHPRHLQAAVWSAGVWLMQRAPCWYSGRCSMSAIAKHNVSPGQLTLHADRGGPMKAKATRIACLLTSA